MIYAGTRGYLDPIAVADVGRFETELLARLHGQHPEPAGSHPHPEGADRRSWKTQLKAVLDAFAATFA